VSHLDGVQFGSGVERSLEDLFHGIEQRQVGRALNDGEPVTPQGGDHIRVRPGVDGEIVVSQPAPRTVHREEHALEHRFLQDGDLIPHRLHVACRRSQRRP
jgi:hypothetical protein